ncbi:DUF58 domain-containing protein [Halorarius halobius]|uniref:DUF58 domain-containing protein n=1 Tax=Halorarius halobius TaxID=2962671 RepID=UPI0020CEA7FC|nr:DUF58 domain-containing protein [Halorarius halobius]
MRGTRRFWASVALGVVLAVLAVLVDSPVPLVGAALVAAWLVARQYQFSRAVGTIRDDLSVDVTVTPRSVTTGQPATVTLAASLPDAPPLPVAVSVTPPVATTGSDVDERTVALSPDARDATTTFTIRVPTAGAHSFERPTVEVGDGAGLFTETVPVGERETLTVEPPAPRDVHIGQGGEEVAAAYGRHDANRLGSGLDPAELQKYVPGDETSDIDWKATARFNELYVRKFESETDRETALVVDHRAALGTGRAGETQLDYLREAALTFLASARKLQDPIGLYTVGDAGLTNAWDPEAGTGQFQRLRRTIQELEPTSETESGKPLAGSPGGRTPGEARTAAAALADDDSAFATRLRPYYERPEPYVERISSTPLFGTVRSRVDRLRGSVWTVILTDDRHRAELRETVKLARRGDDHVLVFLAPRMLFETDAMVDIDDAYDRYVDFEEFRRDLARLDRVEAFEVAPGDRLGAMLSARQAQRNRARR